MKKYLSNYFLLSVLFSAVCLISLLTSCKKEELDSKEITYELSGNFGKAVVVRYTPTDGTLADTEETVSLPWKKAVVPNAINASVGLVVTGDNGTPGSNVVAKIFVNGLEARTVAMQADVNGDFVININYLF